MNRAASTSPQKPSGVQRLLRAELAEDSLGLAWLGQAGFALQFQQCRWLIDPYLSDYLAAKYRGGEFSHERLMPAPVAPTEITGVDWIFCTHRHSDHMDPGSLPALARNNPGCLFVVPRAEKDAAVKAGIPEERMRAVTAGESFGISTNVAVHVVAAAHETLQVNERGEHHFLGFIFETPLGCFYHSGDCVPYDGLAEELLRHRIEVALLPINGRDRDRMSKGFAGNMTFSEAKALCLAARIPCLIPHHFGMFAFNSLDPVRLREESPGPYPRTIVFPTPENYFQCWGTGFGHISVF